VFEAVASCLFQRVFGDVALPAGEFHPLGSYALFQFPAIFILNFQPFTSFKPAIYLPQIS